MRAAINHLTRQDPVLAAIIQAAGPCRLTYMPATFESLVRSIVFQQLSGNVARVIYGRLAAAVPNGEITPPAILKLRPDKMRRLGLSRQKIAYIRDLARQTKRGAVVFESLPALADEAVIEHLTQVKGIGVWTAQMFLMFALRRKNVLPTGDLGVRTAIRKAYGLPELPKPEQIEELARGWHPYCTVASWYLWRSLEGKAAL